MIRFYSPTRHHAFNMQNCASERVASPKTNIFEENNGYSVEMVIPGFKKEDITIKVDDKSLIINGSLSEETISDRKVISRTFEPAAFEKRFTLSDTLNSEAIKATFSNGILTLFIPKKEEEEVKSAKTITIE